MSVNRYEFEDYGTNEPDGRYVTYEDYAALEARCAALVAENAGLNKFIKTDCWVWDDKSEEYIDAVDCMPEIPATDAYLAEVLASGVDEVCLKISNAIVNCYQDEQVGLDAAATICGDFAAQLRKGGAIEENQSFLSDEDCHAFVNAFTKGAAQ